MPSLFTCLLIALSPLIVAIALIAAMKLKLRLTGGLNLAGLTIDDIITDVAQETSLEQSVIKLLGNVSAQLGAAGTDATKLANLKATIDQNCAAMAAAITANTPGAAATDGTGSGTASGSGSGSAATGGTSSSP